MDSNHRPSGYEPDELPLLHAASLRAHWTSYRLAQHLPHWFGARTLSPSPKGTSTYGAAAFHDPVRDGTGWDHRASRTPMVQGLLQVQNTDQERHVVETLKLDMILFVREALVHVYWLSLPLARPPTPATYPGDLPGDLPGKSSEGAHLRAHFPLRCCQRFLLPAIATELAGRPTTPPPAGRPRRSSRTRRSSRQHPKRS